MATHKSAIKRSKQNEKNRMKNMSIKANVRTEIKKVLKDVESKNSDGAKAALAKAIPAIDKAASKGAFHKKNASRKISRLTKKVNGMAG